MTLNINLTRQHFCVKNIMLCDDLHLYCLEMVERHQSWSHQEVTASTAIAKKTVWDSREWPWTSSHTQLTSESMIGFPSVCSDFDVTLLRTSGCAASVLHFPLKQLVSGQLKQPCATPYGISPRSQLRAHLQLPLSVFASCSGLGTWQHGGGLVAQLLRLLLPTKTTV